MGRIVAHDSRQRHGWHHMGLAGVLALLALGVSLACSPAQAPERAHLSGAGQVEMVNLWEVQGCQRTSVRARLAPGTPILILDRKDDCSPRLYKVVIARGDAGQQGWVTEQFIAR